MSARLLLDYVYHHASTQPERIFLTQPYGGGQTIDYTWGEVVDQASRMAMHLRSVGISTGMQVALLSKNCAHFVIAELAIWMAGGTTVAIFPTETPDTISFVLRHSDAKLLFVGKLDSWAEQKSGVPADLPCIALPLAPATSHLSWDRIIACNQPLAERARRLPKDLAMILYTSGSTGTPKGAMHSFERITHVAEQLVLDAQYTPDDRVISYLPLAHVFERAYGAAAAFVASPRVYFAESVETFLEDIRRARPTLFVSVPRLWVKFQQGVHRKLPPAKLGVLLRIPVLNNLVRRKILTCLGLDHVRLAGSGSAPIPPEVLVWYRSLGLNLMEGYGMTEDFGYSHRSCAEAKEPGYVGIPYPGVEARLSETGEVLIKSPGQMVGYYKQPELTNESLTADGFFRTGDLGEQRGRRASEADRTGQGSFQDIQRQIRGTRPYREPPRREPAPGDGHGLRTRPIGCLRPGGTGRRIAFPD